MVMPMCSDGVSDMFEPSTWNFTAFSADCQRGFWGIKPRRNWAMTNYGGDRLTDSASNIIFR